MKQNIIVTFLMASVFTSNAQVTESGDKVGIHHTNPLSTLHVNGESSADLVWPLWVVNPRNNPEVTNYGVGIKLKHSHNEELNKWSGIASIQETSWANNSGLALYANRTEYMRISHNGDVGIGISLPTEKLELHNGNIAFSTPNQSIISGTDLNGLKWIVDDNSSGRVSQVAATIRYVATGTWNGSASPALMSFETISAANSGLIQRMVINQSGDVGIGTDEPDAKLAVSGKIHAEEVKVSASVPAPDYVFEEDYPLASLDEIKAYITENKHLPEVPSAKEMEANGIELGEMNMLLLKKIEELTLHMIKQNIQNQSQQVEIQELREEIRTLNNK